MLWLVSFSTTLIFTYKTFTISILITETQCRYHSRGKFKGVLLGREWRRILFQVQGTRLEWWRYLFLVQGNPPPPLLV